MHPNLICVCREKVDEEEEDVKTKEEQATADVKEEEDSTAITDKAAEDRSVSQLQYIYYK